mmetsp:Transcript_32428/g.52255  ORF Transcript_32428/g.52255 Transcript_32428/m.52255 type:complete len:207 (+) Transcript_32428:1064-1684(+)
MFECGGDVTPCVTFLALALAVLDSSRLLSELGLDHATQQGTDIPGRTIRRIGARGNVRGPLPFDSSASGCGTSNTCTEPSVNTAAKSPRPRSLEATEDFGARILEQIPGFHFSARAQPEVWVRERARVAGCLGMGTPVGIRQSWMKPWWEYRFLMTFACSPTDAETVRYWLSKSSGFFGGSPVEPSGGLGREIHSMACMGPPALMM